MNDRCNLDLRNCDCMELLKETPDKYYELAIVDPPYGINFARKHTGNGWIVRESKVWDKSKPKLEYFNNLFRVSKNQIICGANYFVEYLQSSMGWIVWNKCQRNFTLADGELIFTSFNRALRIFDYSRGKGLAIDTKKIHPTQKPVDLYKWILKNYAKEGDKILDTHLGSMSIAIACWDMKFDLVGCELDKDYYEQGIARVEQHKKQLQFF